MIKNYDVIVLGGGTAGVPAAVAAARAGARTLIIERFGNLGGTSVYGIPFLGSISGGGEVVNKGIFAEIIRRLTEENGTCGYARGAYWNTPKTPDKYQFSIMPFDPEVYKYVAQTMVTEAGAEILYYSQLSDVSVSGGKIQSIEVVNKSGKQNFSAGVYIDCTGDADLVFKAGGEFIAKEKAQNSSILFRIGGVDLGGFVTDLHKGEKVKGHGDWHTRILKTDRETGKEPALTHIAGHFMPVEGGKEITFTAVSLRDGEIFLNATRTTGINGADAESLSAGEIAERKNVMQTFKSLRDNVPSFKNAYIISTSPLGIRETRNIKGDYVLTREDVLNGTNFPDGVARGAYPIDIHDPDGGRTSFQFIKDGGWYNIPYGCLLPANLDGILTAGRCISATHNANGTTRIMGSVVSQGEAAGTAAALAVKSAVPPRNLDVQKLRQILTDNGALV